MICRDESENVLLDEACRNQTNTEIVKLLIDAGAEVNPTDIEVSVHACILIIL